MALINCPECNHEISDQSISCPNCGYPIKDKKKPVTKKKSSTSGCFPAILLIGLFLAVVIFWPRSEDNTPKDIPHSSMLAYDLVSKQALNGLKAPKSAEFPDISTRNAHTKYLGDGRYEINSYVDSQNSFGAMLRTYFTAVIKFTGDSYQIEKVEFDK